MTLEGSGLAGMKADQSAHKAGGTIPTQIVASVNWAAPSQLMKLC